MTQTKTIHLLTITGTAAMIGWMGYLTFLAVANEIRARNTCLYEWAIDQQAVAAARAKGGISFTPDTTRCDP